MFFGLEEEFSVLTVNLSCAISADFAVEGVPGSY
jgi:hypothetical protein